jgi:hypothetical protein
MGPPRSITFNRNLFDFHGFTERGSSVEVWGKFSELLWDKDIIDSRILQD